MSLRLLSIVLASGLGALAAADLGPPTRLTIHPDGAALTWTITVPATGIEVDLPATPSGTIAVEGAAWTISETRIEAPPPPASVLALIDERNRLDDARDALDDEERLLNQASDRLSARLPGVDPGGAPVLWVPAIDAAIASRSSLLQRRATWAAAINDLSRRAEAAARGAAAALRLGVNGRVSAADVASSWAGVATPAPVRRMRLDHPAGGTATVRLLTNNLTWTPSSVLIVDGVKTSLIRRATLVKPEALDLPAIETDLVATNRSEALRGPEERPIDIAADAIASVSRRLVSITSSAPKVERTRQVTAAAISRSSTPPTASTIPETPATSSDLAPERWQVGTLGLVRGSRQQVVDLPAEPLTIGEDRWELAPIRSPVAQRHAIILLGARGLQPGLLTIVVDGRVTGSGWFQGAAPGTAVDVCLEEDVGVFAEPGLAWMPGEGERTPTRHKEGWTWHIHHLGATQRKVRFLASTAVSRLREVTITLLAETSPGSSEPSPGLRAWEIDLVPGASTSIGLGWIITTSGGFTLR